jgi:hypothetical protein
MENTSFDLTVRYLIYSFFVEHCKAPTYQEIAALAGETETRTRAAFHALHAHHMIFLEHGSDAIRMANPFSAIPTSYQVKIGQKQWWANCAWDTLGIAAALHSDAVIEARYPDSDETTELRVENGGVDGKGNVVYFALPCRQWYDDLVFT